jgi:nucleotide-binding universal stress UspA family protein
MIVRNLGAGGRGAAVIRRRYRTIVVYVNGTAEDESAVATAASIAAASDAHLILLCPYRKSALPDAAAIAQVLKDEAFLLHGSFAIDTLLHAARERAHSHGARRITARTAPGSPRRVVLEVADEVGADLVVIGGNSTWAQRWFAGAIVRRSPIDVLVAYAEPDRARHRPHNSNSVPATSASVLPACAPAAGEDGRERGGPPTRPWQSVRTSRFRPWGGVATTVPP